MMCVPQRMDPIAKTGSIIRVAKRNIDPTIHFDLQFIDTTSGSLAVIVQDVLYSRDGIFEVFDNGQAGCYLQVRASRHVRDEKTHRRPYTERTRASNACEITFSIYKRKHSIAAADFTVASKFGVRDTISGRRDFTMPGTLATARIQIYLLRERTHDESFMHIAVR